MDDDDSVHVKIDLSGHSSHHDGGARGKPAATGRGGAGAARFKKAPDAPKRFKSAFIIFSAEKHKEIKEEHAKVGRSEKTTDIAKLVSEAWRELNPEDKEIWESRARKDKARYEVEKAMYKGPWKIPANKRTPKDPLAPKRPMSAFLAYSNQRRASLKRANPNASNADLSKMLSKTWKEEDLEVRRQYMDEEAELRANYKVEMAKWRKRVAEEKKAERKEREAMAMQTAEARANQPLGSAEQMPLNTGPMNTSRFATSTTGRGGGGGGSSSNENSQRGEQPHQVQSIGSGMQEGQDLSGSGGGSSGMNAGMVAVGGPPQGMGPGSGMAFYNQAYMSCPMVGQPGDPNAAMQMAMQPTGFNQMLAGHPFAQASQLGLPMQFQLSQLLANQQFLQNPALAQQRGALIYQGMPGQQQLPPGVTFAAGMPDFNNMAVQQRMFDAQQQQQLQQQQMQQQQQQQMAAMGGMYVGANGMSDQVRAANQEDIDKEDGSFGLSCQYGQGLQQGM